MSSLNKVMFFILKFLFIRKVLCFPFGNETHSFYDQKQTGKYNIHISLRDVAIIEVDKNEFSDDTVNSADEYYYDEEDLTIRPITSWITTTIKTPQLIVNTSKSETVDLQNIKNKKLFVQNSSFPVKQPPKLSLLESSLDSSLLPFSERTVLEYDMGVSVAKKPDLLVPSKPSLINIPIQKNTKENNKNDVLKDHKTNTNIPSILYVRNVLSKIPANCRNYQLRDANGNCRSLKRQTFLKSLFGMMKLMRNKN